MLTQMKRRRMLYQLKPCLGVPNFGPLSKEEAVLIARHGQISSRRQCLVSSVSSCRDRTIWEYIYHH